MGIVERGEDLVKWSYFVILCAAAQFTFSMAYMYIYIYMHHIGRILRILMSAVNFLEMFECILRLLRS